MLSPDLFNIYSEMIMRNLEDMEGCIIRGNNVNNLRYADDEVLISNTEKDLQRLLNAVKEAKNWQG